MEKLGRFSLISPLLLLFWTLFFGCSSVQTDFTISNNLDLDRNDEPIILTRAQILEKYGQNSIPQGQIPLPFYNDNPIPAQVDDTDMNGEWDELAFTIDMPSNGSKTVTLKFLDQAEYPEFENRTKIRFGVLGDNGVQPLEKLSIAADEVPPPPFSRFQMDGPAWENDKVGFRHYIDGRNARDVYGKVTTEMALDSVGISNTGTLEDNYHVLRPWGRDIISVGNSLGLGGLAILRNNEPVRLGVRMEDVVNNVDTTTYQLITEGPVRTIFRLTYEGWQAGNSSVSLVNDVSIWAGQYAHTNEVQITQSDVRTDTLLVGLVNIHNSNPPKVENDSRTGYSGFYTHDKQTYENEWFLGMGLIFPNQNYLGDFEAPESGPGITNSFLLQFELTDQKKLKYDVLAGWELSDENFSDSTYFSGFMAEQIRKKANPLVIE